jgi:hypothetical protein
MENSKSIKVIDHFLPEKLYDEYNKYSKDLLQNQSNTFTTNYIWGNALLADSNTVLVHKVTNSELLNSYSSIIKEKLDRDIDAMLFYYWMPCSHIPWHDDDGHNGGITVYLNEEWCDDHGGLFLFDEGNEIIRGIYPRKNRAIEQYGNVLHSVSPTTMQSNIRRTIQTFF